VLQNFPIKLFCLGLRLGPELSLKDVDTDLVLPERRPSPTLARIEPHQRTMNRFLERIERKQTDRGLNGRLSRLALGLMAKQPGKGLEHKLSEPLALGHQPFLVGGFVHAEPLE